MARGLQAPSCPLEINRLAIDKHGEALPRVAGELHFLPQAGSAQVARSFFLWASRSIGSTPDFHRPDTKSDLFVIEFLQFGIPKRRHKGVKWLSAQSIWPPKLGVLDFDINLLVLHRPCRLPDDPSLWPLDPKVGGEWSFRLAFHRDPHPQAGACGGS